MRKRRTLLNPPNLLTLSRFALAPVMLGLVMALSDPVGHPDAWIYSLLALLVLLLTLLTDLLDGMLARARGEVTIFGKIMDPVADSTFFMTVLFGLSASQRFGPVVSVWLPILVLYREVAIHIFRRYAALKGDAVPAKISGKVKMFSQSLVIAVFFLLVLLRDWTHVAGVGAWLTETTLASVALWSSVFVVAVNLLSLIEYSRDVPELVAEYVADSAPRDPEEVQDGKQR
ncbi:MAG: CDP-alcohol phosphatidyltransferase family protein [Planctomycetota bacterium]|jgi:CDP-diacylglycerol--glycerol-3-phosphate 3-phosphatidyltransferase|nr:CDP-alcohol phosphatidyltransferase family protein [Planctomycetota bacterium]